MSGDEKEPNRPRNMKGLLHFCTEMTAREDAPNNGPSPAPLDPERRAFLANVMSSICVNHAKRIAAHLQTLANSQDIHEPMSETSNEEAVLADIVEIVHDIDNANDLMKMGGIPVLMSCLNSVHAIIIQLSCEVLGVICQNNPKSQDAVLNYGALATLLELVDTHRAVCVKAKALYAVSCLVRGYDPGMEAFDKCDGFSHLMRAMQCNDDKLFVKAVFLIAALIEEYKPSTEQLVSMGYTELLTNYLLSGDLTGHTTCSSTPTTTHQPNDSISSEQQSMNNLNMSKEHCSSALLRLCSVSDDARTQCRGNEALMEYLDTRLGQVKHVEEHQEETDYITELLKLMNEPLHDTTLSDDAEEADCR